MRQYLFIGVWQLLASVCLAQEWEDRQVFNAQAAGATLRVISSTDTHLFAPLIQSFVAANPSVSIEYLVTATADIDTRFRADPEAYDVSVSSAMDLQLKLANDGYALPLPEVLHPPWAVWRQSLFAFTSEPATIVVNPVAFDGVPIPQTRQELIEVLRSQPQVFRGRIGTYDIRQSGLGYLFATQDARASETFWRLMEVMGALDVRLYCCSGEMIDDLATGSIAVAYNVLGSYALARVDSQDSLTIIQPSDFTTTMMRTVLVSQTTPQPEAATAFVKHLISQQSETEATERALPPLHPPEGGTNRAPIALEPALMTFLDALKRQKFQAEWENAVIQN